MRSLKKASWALIVGLSLTGSLAAKGALALGYAGVAVGFAPPAIPATVQPPCPGDGFLWTPGYWAYDPVRGYYWVAGAWVLAPAVGLLWTPGYWAWESAGYRWHAGYWGPRVGFYGGVNYGSGYFGSGYRGGYWEHGAFNYNRSVNNIDPGHVGHWYGGEGQAARAGFTGGAPGIRSWRPSASRAGAAAAYPAARANSPASWTAPAPHWSGAHLAGASHAPAGHAQAVHASAGRSWGGGRSRG